jgi:hypothetical protein
MSHRRPLAVRPVPPGQIGVSRAAQQFQEPETLRSGPKLLALNRLEREGKIQNLTRLNHAEPNTCSAEGDGPRRARRTRREGKASSSGCTLSGSPYEFSPSSPCPPWSKRICMDRWILVHLIIPKAEPADAPNPARASRFHAKCRGRGVSDPCRSLNSFAHFP